MIQEILLIYGNAGTGKTTCALSYLGNPLVITKTNKLREKYEKMGLSAMTSAKALGIHPLPKPTYALKPEYEHTNLFPWLPGHPLPWYEHYYERKQRFEINKRVKASYKNICVSRDILFDDCGLLSELDALGWFSFFGSAKFEPIRIAFTFDPEQLNYGGIELIRWIKGEFGDIVKEIVLTKEHRFEGQKCKWHDFDKFKNVPIISSAEEAPNSMFVAHSRPYLDTIRERGWSKRKSINIDKVQGREYDSIIVSLFGLAALVRCKVPGYKSRIYTTITRGKKFIFYAHKRASKKQIEAAIRDLSKVLSEVNRPMPFYDSSIFTVETKIS